MSGPRLTLDQLLVLDAIDASGGFASAAQQLGRVTSAVSYAVRSLEQTLGLSLFERQGRRAVLTAHGRRVLDEARHLLAEASKLELLARQLRGEWEPRLSLVVEGILPMRPVLRALRAFRETCPVTHVSLHVEHLSGVRERFERERADLMLVIDHAPSADYVAQPLMPVRMALLARADHPLRQLKRIDRRALARHVELVVEDSRREGAGRTGRLSLGSPQLFRLSDFHLKRQALLEGVGYGWMPRHLVEHDVRRGRLAPLGFTEGDEYTFEPHLVCPAHPPLGRAASVLSALLLGELGAAQAKATAPA